MGPYDVAESLPEGVLIARVGGQQRFPFEALPGGRQRLDDVAKLRPTTVPILVQCVAHGSQQSWDSSACAFGVEWTGAQQITAAQWREHVSVWHVASIADVRLLSK
jgi:hypothetical protein